MGVAPAELAIARGAPQEDGLHINFDMELSGPLRERFEAACASRQCEPAALMAEIIAAVIGDDLFAAVLDT